MWNYQNQFQALVGTGDAGMMSGPGSGSPYLPFGPGLALTAAARGHQRPRRPSWRPAAYPKLAPSARS